MKATTLHTRNSNSHRGKDKYYQSKEWKRKRDEVIKRDKGICQPCKRKGRVHFAGKYQTVDHIIPRKLKNIALAIKPDDMNELDWLQLKELVRKNGPDIIENLELTCKRKHDQKSAKEKR